MASWLAGVWLPIYSELPLTQIWWSAVIISVTVWTWSRKRWVLFPCACCVVAAAGSLYLTWWRESNYVAVANKPFADSTLVLEGSTIRDDRTTTLVRTSYGNRPNLRFTLVEKGTIQRTPGEVLQITGYTRPPPFQMESYARWMERHRIQGSIVAKTAIKTGSAAGFLELFPLVGARLQRSILSSFPGEPGQLLAGLLLGAKQSLSNDLTAALRATGTSHLVAISGANVVIILGIVLQILPTYSLRSRTLYSVLIGLIICLLTGASASVVRGALTVGIASILQLLGRHPNRGGLFILPAFLMSVGNPLLPSSDVGFQLSFAAIGGVLFVQPYLARILERPFKHVPRVITSSLQETAAATIGTAPVAYTVFGTTSWLGLAVNPLLLWLVPPISFLGLAYLCFGWIAPVKSILVLVLTPMLRIFLGCIRWFAAHLGGLPP